MIPCLMKKIFVKDDLYISGALCVVCYLFSSMIIAPFRYLSRPASPCLRKGPAAA